MSGGRKAVRPGFVATRVDHSQSDNRVACSLLCGQSHRTVLTREQAASPSAPFHYLDPARSGRVHRSGTVLFRVILSG